MEPITTPTELCQSFLEKNDYAVLATSTLKGVPHASTILYIIDDNWDIYFCTREHTTKVKNLKENTTVALAVGFGPAPQGVQIHGVAEKLKGSVAEDCMTNFLVKKDAYYTTFLKFEGFDFVAYKITPKHIRWISIDPDGDKEIFTDIK